MRTWLYSDTKHAETGLYEEVLGPILSPQQQNKCIKAMCSHISQVS